VFYFNKIRLSWIITRQERVLLKIGQNTLTSGNFPRQMTQI